MGLIETEDIDVAQCSMDETWTRWGSTNDVSTGDSRAWSWFVFNGHDRYRVNTVNTVLRTC